MNPPKFAACIEDIRTWAAGQSDVKTAIAYGSVARGTAGEESDLDLLLAPKARHDALAHELFLLGARHDVTISPYLVERGSLGDLDP
ncbi:MAG: nucleotidyltransferase domain-containing protein, partial [Methanobacteriota archaeon]